MNIRIEIKNWHTIVPDGSVELPLPLGQVIVPRTRLTQAELDSEIVFEMLVALNEIRDLGNDETDVIVDRALAVYEKNQAQIDKLRGVTPL